MIRKQPCSDDGDQGLTSGERIFLVTLEPINEHITTDDLLRKLQLVAGGCGIRINAAQLVSPESPLGSGEQDSISNFTGPSNDLF
ncbi:hypothetical protein [Gimesia maris]|uniref:Uncharacterized protein n=1 Tax=Gimesia maris TaxID=122 RepID=A0ABX5YPN6_9PLAN|nr:hypothetical protein [Gimesia maris]EDL58370.1 hypothetical protein PM8797T_26980 [Gimesia maris DSM 8797]QEG17535.1 hypothetical protein GmarT_34170 [Gimesia maris]QGQ29401.1 hypothetical protein F1729_12435 [Gimesia maris]